MYFVINNEGKKEMENKFFTEKDIKRKRKVFFRFYKYEDTGGLRGFNSFHEEPTLQEVEEIIAGLTSSYLNISKDQYKDRTLSQIKYDVNIPLMNPMKAHQ